MNNKIKRLDGIFQKEVIERDESCLMNGIRFDCLYSPINAHHIVYKRFPHLRHDIRNGAGLCTACHDWAHTDPRGSEYVLIGIHLKNGIIESFDEWEKLKLEAKK